MMMHPEYETLNDFADGLLDEQGKTHVQTHIATCGECAELVEQIRTLTADARSLPHEMVAPPEIWQSVAAATIDSRAPSKRAALWQLRYHLAAAALVLLVAASTVTWYFAAQREQQVVVREVPVAAGNTSLVAYQAVEAEYGKAADELVRLLEQRRGSLDTAVVRSVEENLRIMDEAIRRAREALTSDPNNNDVAGILTATQESKLRMLRRAVGVAGGT